MDEDADFVNDSDKFSTDFRPNVQKYSFAPHRKTITFTNKRGLVITKQIYDSSRSPIDVTLRALVEKLKIFSTVSDKFGDTVRAYDIVNKYSKIINIQTKNVTLLAAAIFIYEYTPTNRMNSLDYGIEAKLRPEEWAGYVKIVSPFIEDLYKLENRQIAMESDLLSYVQIIRQSPL